MLICEKNDGFGSAMVSNRFRVIGWRPDLRICLMLLKKMPFWVDREQEPAPSSAVESHGEDVDVGKEEFSFLLVPNLIFVQSDIGGSLCHELLSHLCAFIHEMHTAFPNPSLPNLLHCVFVLMQVHQLEGADVDCVPMVGEGHAPFHTAPVHRQAGLGWGLDRLGAAGVPAQRNLLIADGNYYWKNYGCNSILNPMPLCLVLFIFPCCCNNLPFSFNTLLVQIIPPFIYVMLYLCLLINQIVWSFFSCLHMYLFAIAVPYVFISLTLR